MSGVGSTEPPRSGGAGSAGAGAGGSDLVLVERDGAVGVVLLNRPKQLNALSGELMGALVAALEELDADPEVRAIV
ncbi:MAG TPA: enoyl-CoA hydratase-related protein, partial [Gaiellaceae bacterium]|nr:enoyl-CoA hydratase-related protein [Gaiellaceae bacterium]